MTTPSSDKHSRDEAYWAQTSTLKVSKVPTGALNLNVEGRQLLGPLQGFGQLWQKTFRIRLNGVSVKSTEVIKVWKDNFPKFWPKWSRYYVPLAGIAPGEVTLINSNARLVARTMPTFHSQVSHACVLAAALLRWRHS